MFLRFISYSALALGTCSGIYAQTTWNGGGDAVYWIDTANWSNGSPGSSTQVIFSSPEATLTAPGSGALLQVGSISFQSGIGSAATITVGEIGDALQVNGAINNQTAFNHIFELPVTAGATATWTGPLTFKNTVNVDLRSLTLSGAHTFNGTLNFSITSTSNYGRFLGSGSTSFSSVTINIGGGYTGGTAGDTFDFTTSNFTGATLNLATLPSLNPGLAWDTSQFISQGILTVQAIPEPATFATLIGFAAVGAFGLRRRPRKLAA